MRKFPLRAKCQLKVKSTATGLRNNTRYHFKLHTVFTRLIAALERIEGIDLFTDTSAILNLLDLMSIMGCPGEHSLSIYAHFSGKKRTSLYIYREKGVHCYIQTRHNDIFLPGITIFF